MTVATLPLDEIAAGADARDRAADGAFPEAPIALLEAAGVLDPPRDPVPLADELATLRAVAAADMGVARILDGHLNALERLRVQAPAAVRDDELGSRRRYGVWGGAPGPGEGEPARLDGDRVSGVMTFCSGAGGLDRALVLVREGDAPGPPVAVWVDLRGAEVDRTWFTGAGMRSSASHRVVFDGARVLAVLGSIAEQPWFARDAVRTASTWAGAADAAVDDALARLATRDPLTDLEALAAGRLQTARTAMAVWLDHAAARLDDPAIEPDDAFAVAAQTRTAIAAAARGVLDEAERATGSRPQATASALNRAGRDLRLFLLQHRLEPILARAGRAALEAAR